MGGHAASRLLNGAKCQALKGPTGSSWREAERNAEPGAD